MIYWLINWLIWIIVVIIDIIIEEVVIGSGKFKSSFGMNHANVIERILYSWLKKINVLLEDWNCFNL